MFSRLMSAIYSGHSCNFLQPRAQFTRRGGRTFSEVHGVDHATTIRAIADIWFPPACEFGIRDSLSAAFNLQRVKMSILKTRVILI
jgi:hypothetical protein